MKPRRVLFVFPLPVDDGQAVAAFDWRDITKALSLPACRVE